MASLIPASPTPRKGVLVRGPRGSWNHPTWGEVGRGSPQGAKIKHTLQNLNPGCMSQSSCYLSYLFMYVVIKFESLNMSNATYLSRVEDSCFIVFCFTHQDVQLDQDGEGVFAHKGLGEGRGAWGRKIMSEIMRFSRRFCICCCFS